MRYCTKPSKVAASAATPSASTRRTLNPVLSTVLARARSPSTVVLATCALLAASLLLRKVSFASTPGSSTMSRLSFASSASANIAYFVQIVPSTIPHLPRLFRRIYHPQNVYAIHFDVKIPQAQVQQTVRHLRSLVPSLDRNTHLVPPDVLVYNGVSMILNTLAGMTFLLDVDDSWHFFINLSGSDYPLTDAYLPRQLLAEALPFSPVFFSLANATGWLARFKVRSEKLYLDPSLTHAHENIPPLIETSYHNPLIHNMSFIPVHSEAWMILSRPFVHYLVHSSTSRRMLVSLANMRGADEYFFASLAFNHPDFNRSLVPHSFRKVVWSYNGVHAGQHPYYIDMAESGRWVFADSLRTCSQWHARKFLHNDSALMDTIDTFANDPQRVSKIRREFGKVMMRLKTRYESSVLAQSAR